MTRERKIEFIKSDGTALMNAVAGTIVYPCAMPDYGLADDDTRMTGIRHVSVTLNPDGDYPFFTVPENSIERAKAAA